MMWKNKSYQGWRTKFAWFPRTMTETNQVLWLGTYEVIPRKKKHRFESYFQTRPKFGGFKFVSGFCPTWTIGFAWVPIKTGDGHTVWLGRYAFRYTGQPNHPTNHELWSWEKYTVPKFVELKVLGQLADDDQAVQQGEV